MELLLRLSYTSDGMVRIEIVYTNELGISERQVQRILKELKESGIILRIGANRSRKWIIR
ncbi:MAG TPA: hypothetical protein DCZ91_23005 [Lachnospiraceae bacterium]|nr:hypothetical protein [Lachnospiraceae bacterium]